MAIGPDQKVTTTGLMGGTPKMPKVPDLRGLSQGQPQQAQVKAPVQVAERPVEESPDQNIEEKLAQLTEEEKFKLDTILSPSNAAILKKIAPEASSVIDQFTSEEEVLSLPVSTIVSYAMKIYGGDEKLAVQNFINDLSGEQPDNTNVPPGTETQTQGMMAQDPNAEQDITSEMEAIDSGQELV
jgi:hypothetical protein